MISYIEYLGIPGAIATVIIAVFFLMQIVGLILDIKGKAVPVIMNVYGHFKKKRDREKDLEDTLKDVQAVLKEFDAHYNADNIQKRDDWMQWVNGQATVYTAEIDNVKKEIFGITTALQENTQITEEMFIQTSRDRIIDFATKAIQPDACVSREEYQRIFKVYQKYEDFLKERNLPNGEVDINYRMIEKSYKERMANQTFAEDVHL